MKQRHTRRSRRSSSDLAVAVFQHGPVKGEVVATNEGRGVRITAEFSQLPPGKHGCHIHTAGDLRGEGCKGACAHYHIGAPVRHGGAPDSAGTRHTGDLGNIELVGGRGSFKKSYFLRGVKVEDLWGRSAIVHADEDDLGHGDHEDSGTTGHSGTRIGCAIFGRGKL